jgi:hypothetical protein
MTTLIRAAEELVTHMLFTKKDFLQKLYGLLGVK